MRDDALWLEDMLRHAEEAVAMAGGRRRKDLDTDRQLELALTRLVEVVGEAAAHVSPATRARYDIPWKAIVGVRNLLIHAYHRVDRDQLWAMVTLRLPALARTLRA